MNYTYITKQEQFVDVEDWIRNRSYVVFDIETGPKEEYTEEWLQNKKLGLDPYRSEIVTVQIGNRHRQFIIDCRVGLDLKTIKDVLVNEGIGILGVNLRFDCKFVIHHWDIIPNRIMDCMIMEQIIRCGIFPGKHDDTYGKSSGIVRKYTGMRALSERYLDLDIDKDKDLRTGLWRTPPNEFSDRQLEYMAGDCIYPDQIAKEQKSLIVERELASVIQMEHDLIPVIADMELTGIPFNQEYWISLLQDSMETKKEAEKKVDDFLGVKSHSQEDLFSDAQTIRKYDYGSWQQLAKALHEAGYKGFMSSTGKPLSTNSDKLTLKKINGEMPAELVDNIVEYKKAKKKEESYGENFIKGVNPITDRIHPSFTQTCLVTGRMSCSPGMQTIPRDSIYRYAFDAPPGYTLIILDASQIEARIAADLTGDQPAIEVFQNDEDIYSIDGSRLYNRPVDKTTEEGKKLRDRAKVSWLGLSYGQGKRKFNRYCKVFLGTDIPKEETDFLYEKFFEIHWRMREVMDSWAELADPLSSNRFYHDELAAKFIDQHDAYERLYKIMLDRFNEDEQKADKVTRRLIDQKYQIRYSETVGGRKRFFRSDFLGWWTASRNSPIQGCLPSDTNILTKDGWLEIGDFSSGQVWTGKDWAFARRVNKGVSERVRLHLSNGNTFDCDDRHKLLIDNGPWPEWCHIDDIKGKKLRVDNNVDFGNDLYDEESWYWAGRLMGDGWVCNNGQWVIVFREDQERDAFDRFCRWLDGQDIIGETSSTKGYSIDESGQNAIRVQLATKKSKKIWKKWGFSKGLKAVNKRVPPIVYTLDYDRRLSFLLGWYDADGRKVYSRGGIEVGSRKLTRLTSASFGACKDLVKLCQTLDIFVSIGSMQTNNTNSSWWDVYFHNSDKDLFVEEVEYLGIDQEMFTLTVFDDKHAFSSEGLISKNTAADIQKATMLEFQKMHWQQGYDAHIINVVHDEIITLVSKDQAEELYNKQIELGTEVGQRFLQDVPMKLEGGISDKWKKF